MHLHKNCVPIAHVRPTTLSANEEPAPSTKPNQTTSSPSYIEDYFSVLDWLANPGLVLPLLTFTSNPPTWQQQQLSLARSRICSREESQTTHQIVLPDLTDSPPSVSLFSNVRNIIFPFEYSALFTHLNHLLSSSGEEPERIPNPIKSRKDSQNQIVKVGRDDTSHLIRESRHLPI